ncbi:hypothetical protein [Corallococcus sp. 4LFB]|uniref:hypothetical protein n=1 Tax=Corallococcus sp. 4LFB TaxID=3383249 RepID=UPI003975A6DD
MLVGVGGPGAEGILAHVEPLLAAADGVGRQVDVRAGHAASLLSDDDGPKDSQGVSGLLGDDAVAVEAEQVDALQASRCQRQPINHATKSGLRESRGELGADSEDVSPAVDVSGARGPERDSACVLIPSPLVGDRPLRL